MVVRRWVGATGLALGVAAAAGAAQLGLAYGIGVIAWSADPDAAGQAWSASLAWACWVAVTSTVTGAVIAERLRSRQDDGEPGQSPDDPRVERVLWHLILAVAAAVGAMVTVVLVAVPAREAAATGVSAPQAQAAGYALVGVLAGVVVTVAVLAARAASTNLILTAAWLWLVAAATVAESVISGRDWSRVPMGFWGSDHGDGLLGMSLDQPTFHNIGLLDAATALGAALLIGFAAAMRAARRGDHPAGVVVSGATGPLVVTVAYLLAQPDLAAASAEDLSRHLVIPYTVMAGLAGSLLASAFGPRTGEAPGGTGKGGATDSADRPAVPAPRRGRKGEQAAAAAG